MHKSPTLARALQAFALAALTTLGATLPAHAGQPASWTRGSTVSDGVTNNGDGTWTYSYTVNNTSRPEDGGPDARQPILVDWELPWFGDAGITNIQSPFNWTYSIEDIGAPNAATGWEGVADWQTPGDPFYVAGSPFNTVTQVLHWYNLCWVQQLNVPTELQVEAVVVSCEGQFDNAIFPDNSLGGFSFDADFDRTNAPYQASWAFLPVRTGDPAFPLGGIPNSPLARGTIPEPGVLGLIAAALAAGGLVARRRRSR